MGTYLTCVQAVYSQAEGLETEATEGHYYYPSSISDTAPATIVTNVHAADSLLTQPTSAGKEEAFAYWSRGLAPYLLTGIC